MTSLSTCKKTYMPSYNQECTWNWCNQKLQYNEYSLPQSTIAYGGTFRYYISEAQLHMCIVY